MNNSLIFMENLCDYCTISIGQMARKRPEREKYIQIRERACAAVAQARNGSISRHLSVLVWDEIKFKT